MPVCLCRPDEVDAAKARADRVLSEATVSPNYQRLLDQGDATGVADILACGDEEMIRARLAAFEAAGVTDVSVRVLPIGDGRDELLESSRRTREFVATLATDRDLTESQSCIGARHQRTSSTRFADLQFVADLREWGSHLRG